MSNFVGVPAESTLAPPGTDIALAEWTAPGARGDAPQYQAPLHIHHHDDEAWYVLEGRLRLRVGDEVCDVPAGSAIIAPHGRPHTFWNPDPTPVRYLIVMSAQTNALLKELHSGGDRSPEQVKALFEQYGCTLVEE